MQISWRKDPDKLTSILSLPSPRTVSSLPVSQSNNGVYSTSTNLSLQDAQAERFAVEAGVDDEPSLLIGDVNLFLSPYDADDHEVEAIHKDTEWDYVVGEVELMIAVSSQQSKGYGKLAVLIFILYVLQHKDEVANQGQRHKSAVDPHEHTCAQKRGKRLKYLCVKIGKGNLRSIGLFEKLGFVKTASEPNYFGEWELRLSLDDEAGLVERLNGKLKDCAVEVMREVEYRRPSI
jgi:hypothetical protein